MIKGWLPMLACFVVGAGLIYTSVNYDPERERRVSGRNADFREDLLGNMRLKRNGIFYIVRIIIREIFGDTVIRVMDFIVGSFLLAMGYYLMTQNFL